MLDNETTGPVYTIVQSGASAPAQSTNPVQASRSSVHNDITLVDNDLYEMQQHPTTVIHVPPPPNASGSGVERRQHPGDRFPPAVRRNNNNPSLYPSLYPDLALNDPDPPVYAVPHRNRPGDAVVQSEASAPAADTAAGDNYIAPTGPTLYQDLTLIDNDLYG